MGLSPRQADMFVTTTSFCEGRVAANSIHALLHRECFELLPDELFADLKRNRVRQQISRGLSVTL